MAEEFKSGWPQYYYDQFPNRIVYEVKMEDGSIVQATVDDATQYRAEGLQWDDATTGKQIPKHRVAGWREKNKPA